MKSEVLTCKQCNAPLQFSGVQHTITCPYCGAINIIQWEQEGMGMPILVRARRLRDAGSFSRAIECYLKVLDEGVDDMGEVGYELAVVVTGSFSRITYSVTDSATLAVAWKFLLQDLNTSKERVDKIIKYVKELENTYAEEMEYRDSSPESQDDSNRPLGQLRYDELVSIRNNFWIIRQSAENDWYLQLIVT